MLAATLTAAGVIARFMVRWCRNAIHFFKRIEKALENVEHQLYPNSGASLRDAVNRIQQELGIIDIPGEEHAHDRRTGDK